MFDPPAQKDWTWHCWQEWCVPGTASGTRRHTLLSPCTPGQCFHVSANHIQDKIIHHVFIVVGGNVGICNFSFILPPHHLSQSKRGPAHQVWMQNTFMDNITINFNNLTIGSKVLCHVVVLNRTNGALLQIFLLHCERACENDNSNVSCSHLPPFSKWPPRSSELLKYNFRS